MKTNDQFLKEVIALMADRWLASCNRRVIAPEMDGKAFSVMDAQLTQSFFGPATADECRLFIHRAAALDALLTIGRVAGTAFPRECQRQPSPNSVKTSRHSASRPRSCSAVSASRAPARRGKRKMPARIVRATPIHLAATASASSSAPRLMASLVSMACGLRLDQPGPVSGRWVARLAARRLFAKMGAIRPDR